MGFIVLDFNRTASLPISKLISDRLVFSLTNVGAIVSTELYSLTMFESYFTLIGMVDFGGMMMMYESKENGELLVVSGSIGSHTTFASYLLPGLASFIFTLNWSLFWSSSSVLNIFKVTDKGCVPIFCSLNSFSRPGESFNFPPKSRTGGILSL